MSHDLFKRRLAMLVELEITEATNARDAGRLAQAIRLAGKALAILVTTSCAGNRNAIDATLSQIGREIEAETEQMASNFKRRFPLQ